MKKNGKFKPSAPPRRGFAFPPQCLKEVHIRLRALLKDEGALR